MALFQEATESVPKKGKKTRSSELLGARPKKWPMKVEPKTERIRRTASQIFDNELGTVGGELSRVASPLGDGDKAADNSRINPITRVAIQNPLLYYILLSC